MFCLYKRVISVIFYLIYFIIYLSIPITKSTFYLRVSMGHGGKPWVSDFNDPNYIAGRKAMKTGITSL